MRDCNRPQTGPVQSKVRQNHHHQQLCSPCLTQQHPHPFLSIPLDPLIPPPYRCLSRFDPVDPDTISKLLSSSKPTTCSLDPLPTLLLKSCLPVLCPYLTNFFNSSLSHETVPSAF